MKANSRSEEGLYRILRDMQEGSEAISALLEHPIFERRLRQICYRFDLSADYSPEDLYQDVCLRVLRHQDALKNTRNIPHERAFFSWIKIVARHVFYDRLRKSKLPIDSTHPSEEIDVADDGVNLEGQLFLSEFLESIKPLPESHQRAIVLWLDGHSFREISEILEGANIETTYGTVRNWVTSALAQFRGIGVVRTKKRS